MTWTQTWMGSPARHLRVVGPRARHSSLGGLWLTWSRGVVTWTQTWMGRLAHHLRVVGPLARHSSSLSLGHPTCETEPRPCCKDPIRRHVSASSTCKGAGGVRPLGLPGDPPITCTNMCVFYLRQPVIGPDRKRAREL